MTERYFVTFEDVDTKEICFLEAYPDTATSSSKNFFVFNMPEDQSEIKILGRRSCKKTTPTKERKVGMA